MLRRAYSVLLIVPFFFTSLTPAMAMFEVFSQLADELKKIEQSAPEDVGATVQSLESTTFKDVGSGDWFYRYVVPVGRWGIVSGYKDVAGKPTGFFGPGNTVTVAEMLKMSLEAANVDETQCAGAVTIPRAEKHWARPYVICAAEKKMRILESKPNVDRPALRAEVLAILFDAFGDNVPPLFAPFKDVEGHPLESDIAYATALKIVSGDRDANGEPAGTFRPDANVNRAEATKIIYERLRVQVMSRK